MRVRIACLLTLLLAAGGAGCVASEEDGPRLASPATRPVLPSHANDPPPSTSPAPRPHDPNDPGYVMTGDWQAGDAWFYETFRAPRRYLDLRILEARVDNGTTRYTVEERSGWIGSPPGAIYRTVVHGGNYTRVESVDDLGTTIRYAPWAPGLRYFRNGTFAWNETGVTPEGHQWTLQHVVNSFYAGHEDVPLPWGDVVHAARIEHRDVQFEAGGKQTRTLRVRWVDAAYGHDVGFEIDEATRYLLVGAVVGGTRYGTTTDHG